MLSLSIAITTPMPALVRIHLKVGVNASLYGAITLIRSNVLKHLTWAKYVCVFANSFVGRKDRAFLF